MKKMCSRIDVAFLALVSVSAAACQGGQERARDVSPPAETPQAAAALHVRAWEHESSDVPVDSRIHFGRLKNGLRWAWAKNSEPRERCYLRLHVDVGSLAEERDELGMAHFLEHMAFNGSKNFEAGTLIEWFQEHGMSFGADTNAHTAFSETVYKLDLPDSEEKTVREGLLVLRDFADGLLIAGEEVESEKGVIDGEQRERDSAGFRIFQQQLEIMYAGTRIGERLPIGKKEVRDAFTAESVRDFYERWYRPENITLILVGDLGELDPSPLIEEYFASMEVLDDPLEGEPAIGTAGSFLHRYSIYEEEVPVANITLCLLRPWVEEADTIEERIEDLPLQYARSMLSLRLYELAKKEGAPFLSARASSARSFKVFDGEDLSIVCPPEKWEQAIAACEQEHRRALQFGFQQAELEELRADALRGLDEAVEREPTAHSRSLLNRLVSSAEERYVPADAETNRRIMRPAIEALTVEACSEAFQEAWSTGEFSIYSTGKLDLGDDGGEKLLAVFQASQAQPVEAGETIELQEFAYASNEVGGKIAKRTHVEDLDFDMIEFENGVTLDVKPTDFKQNQIMVSASFGEGRLTLDPKRYALDWVGSRVFNGGGLEAHSEDDLRRLSAGKQVGVGFSVSSDSFSLGGATTAEDLLLQCEIICAYLKAPGWRDEGLVQFRRSLPLIFDGLKHQHRGPLLMQFYPELFSNDRRFTIPEEADAAAVEIEDICDWLAPHLREAPIEVSIVGDLDLEQAIAIAARTFGSLPARREWRRYDEHRVAPAPQSGIQQTHEIETQIPKSLVLIVFPTADGFDATLRRRISALNTVVNDRLRINVRERLGAAYSPGSSTQLSDTYPGVGMLMIQAMSDPDKVDTLVEACLEVAESLATEGVTDEEVNRLREPILAKRRDSKRTNSYWMGVLSEAHRNPEHLTEVRTADAFYESYTAADLRPLAAEYLTRERASILVVNPGPGPTDG